jgi:outer membrane protein assembly factor BamB
MWGIDPERGDVRWKTWIGDHIGASVGILGSDVYFPGKDRRFHALDAATGTERWRVDLEGWSMGSPVLALGCAVVRATGGRGLCVDLVNRSILWKADLPSSTFAQTSMAYDGHAFYATVASSVVALGPSGDVLWETKLRANIDPSPIVVGDYVVVAGGGEQVLRAFDRKTGAKVKEVVIGERITATPTIVGGIAYVAGASGTLFAVE